MDEKWTVADMLAGRCTASLVGSTKNLVLSTKHEVPSTTPEEFINEWMEVYKSIGGRKALEDFARANPIKFYDQLMKLLVSMEAPKQVMELHLGRGALSDQELESLSTAELKRRLLTEFPSYTGAKDIIDGDFKMD